MDKTYNPKYCANHQMICHPTRSSYFLKDQMQTLVDANILKL